VDIRKADSELSPYDAMRLAMQADREAQARYSPTSGNGPDSIRRKEVRPHGCFIGPEPRALVVPGR